MNWLVLSVILGLGCLSQARDSDDARLVARYQTKTAFIFTTSVTTVPFTCISGDPATIPCTKRRLRRTAAIGDMKGTGEGLLDSSLDMEGALLTEDAQRDERVAMTFWSTLSSTYTITSTSTNTGTTFSVSYYCTLAGAINPPACG
ncbi:uncharacterized protein LOC125028277 [Penaeus chinensis]|uniref:uncharacterized protein LOC125028277 n=1 Tax=Penaeus chinensis TaxID=139456 RepID=UPI001FB833BC|nr:uncharacterized protein LOC125028277 [Penaeus chinensis]XP_047473673.1 uncharacterized protein LOC125028277 [Penaeus chinensis]